MDIFFHLLTNLLPLYVLIGLGFIAGRVLDVQSKSLANLLIFICVPFVSFGYIVELEFKAEYLALPFILYAVQAVIGFGTLYVGRKIYGDNRANLWAMLSSMANVGYFGLPLAMLLFDVQTVAIYMFMLLGFVVFEATIGYYIAARGQFTARDSLKKLTKFPLIYAVIAGFLMNATDAQMPEQVHTMWGYFKGSYVVLGMMIIGTAISAAPRLIWAPRFIGLSLLGKFVLWPALVYGVIMFDQNVTRMFDKTIYQLLLIMAIVPFAANVTAFAAQMDLRPEKAATTVLLGTIFALFYIPAVLVLTGMC